MVVLNCSPSFVVHVLNHLLLRLVNTDTNDSDFASPVILSLFKHLLVVSHWLLARRAPRCPEVNQNDFAFVVSNLLLFFSIKWHYVTDDLVHVTSTQFGYNID